MTSRFNTRSRSRADQLPDSHFPSRLRHKGLIKAATPGVPARGDQFAEQMRAYEGLGQRTVLVLPAKADETLRLGLLSELVQNYLVKRFQRQNYVPAELRARVRNLVTMRQTWDMLQQELVTQNQGLMFLTQELIASKRTIQESLEEQRRLLALVENSRDFIGFASVQGKALFVNLAGRKLVGLDSDAVTSTVPVDHVLEQDRELLTAGINAALENGNWEGEVRFRNLETGAIHPYAAAHFRCTGSRDCSPDWFGNDKSGHH